MHLENETFMVEIQIPTISFKKLVLFILIKKMPKKNTVVTIKLANTKLNGFINKLKLEHVVCLHT